MAVSNSSRTSIAPPEPGTKPQALALIGRDPAAGLSLYLRQSTRMASKPPQMKGVAPSDPPAAMRLANPILILQRASITASFPVLQAEELEVT